MNTALADWLNSGWIQPETFFPRYHSASPFPFLVLDSFLLPERCRALAREFPAFDSQKALGEGGKPGGKAVHSDLKQLGREWAELAASPVFLGWLEKLTGIRGLLSDPGFLGGGAHESLAGEDLDFHVDFNIHPEHGWHRRLNLLLYLNEGWQTADGGALLLQENPGATEGIVELPPLFNRCVIMESSSRSWHGFRPIAQGRSRKSVALYFYTKEPVLTHALPRHTIYRDWPLRADSADPERLVSRRLQHWERLEKETDVLFASVLRAREALAAHQEKLKARLVEAKGSADLPLLAHQFDEQVQGAYEIQMHLRGLHEEEQRLWQRLVALEGLMGAGS